MHLAALKKYTSTSFVELLIILHLTVEYLSKKQMSLENTFSITTTEGNIAIESVSPPVTQGGLINFIISHDGGTYLWLEPRWDLDTILNGIAAGISFVSAIFAKGRNKKLEHFQAGIKPTLKTADGILKKITMTGYYRVIIVGNEYQVTSNQPVFSKRLIGWLLDNGKIHVQVS